MRGDGPRQPKESSDDARSHSRMLCCLQNTRWVWFAWWFLLLEFFSWGYPAWPILSNIMEVVFRV